MKKKNILYTILLIYLISTCMYYLIGCMQIKKVDNEEFIKTDIKNIDMKDYYMIDKERDLLYTDFKQDKSIIRKAYNKYYRKQNVDGKEVYPKYNLQLTAQVGKFKNDKERINYFLDAGQFEFYSYDKDGNICEIGEARSDKDNNYTEIKWKETPTVFLKSQMEIGKEYVISDNEVSKDTIKACGFVNLKLNNDQTYNECLVVEDVTIMKLSGDNKNNKLYQKYYFAKDIGLIKQMIASGTDEEVDKILKSKEYEYRELSEILDSNVIKDKNIKNQDKSKETVATPIDELTLSEIKEIFKNQNVNLIESKDPDGNSTIQIHDKGNEYKYEIYVSSASRKDTDSVGNILIGDRIVGSNGDIINNNIKVFKNNIQLIAPKESTDISKWLFSDDILRKIKNCDKNIQPLVIGNLKISISSIAIQDGIVLNCKLFYQ